jgi:AcrR family transcriptional regulator
MTDFAASSHHSGPASPLSPSGPAGPLAAGPASGPDAAGAPDPAVVSDPAGRRAADGAPGAAASSSAAPGSAASGSAVSGSAAPGRAAAGRPKRAEVTRAALLTAAGGVFAAAGYADANVDEIVEKAGTSVGTLYHHFGSKADLYVRLYTDYQSRQHHRSARAFRAAVAAGESDPMTLFLTGTRAYLEGAWNDRHIGKIFASGGGPPGFDGLVRQRFRDWLDINAAGFDQPARPFSPTKLLVLTAIVTEAGREVTGLPSRRDAHAFIDEVLGLMRQLHPPQDPGARD